MKLPLSSYQKLFDSFLLNEFPEIQSIQVDKSGPIIFIVRVYLKPAEEQTGMISCKFLMNALTKRMIELSQYLGGGVLCSLDIYFEGELLCHDIFRM
jgi:hypothetical protein